MDLTKITAEYEQAPIYSFLSTSWAIIADCDTNSEVIRCIGNARFTLWGAMRILFLLRYPGVFSFNGFYVRNKY
jgi:sphingosine kinase